MLQYYRSYLRPTRPSRKSQAISLKSARKKKKKRHDNVSSSEIRFEARDAAPKRFIEKDQSDPLQGEQSGAL